MKIQTKDGIVEVPKIIKYLTINNRKVAIHRSYLNNEFTNDHFTATDYISGYSIRVGDTVNEAIDLAQNIIDKNPNFDYSQYEAINK